MNAPSVASAVKSTTFTRPSTPAVPITPSAVILKVLLPPVAPSMSAIVLFRLSKTPIASSARYSTVVAMIATKNSTNETANENFMTDHGSMRLTNRRARRGPRVAAATVERADRTASATLAVPARPMVAVRAAVLLPPSGAPRTPGAPGAPGRVGMVPIPAPSTPVAPELGAPKLDAAMPPGELKPPTGTVRLTDARPDDGGTFAEAVTEAVVSVGASGAGPGVPPSG